MKYLKRFVTLILAFSFWTSYAQTPSSSTTFVAHTLTDHVDEGVYALSALNDKGVECFMQSEVDKKKNYKLTSLPLEVNNGNVLIPHANMLWKVILKDDKILLYSQSEDKYLVRKKEGTTQIALSSTPGSGTMWDYTINSHGRLQLMAGNRMLSVGVANDEKYYFACYASDFWNEYASQGFMLYASTAASNTGTNQMPVDNQRLGIISSRGVWTQLGEAQSIDDAILNDGTLAPTPSMMVLTAEVNSNGTFRLKGEQGYFSYSLTETESPAEWQILNGCICTTELQPRVLCWQQNHLVLSVERSEEVACLRSVAPQPQLQKEDNNVWKLTGGWSASALQSLPIDNTVRCLDLTAIVLPVYAESLPTQDKNIPVFINAVQPVPPQWRFVVKCSVTGNHLVDAQLQLYDKKPFFTDRSFTIGSHQVVYERSVGSDNQWQSLSLPFLANVQAGVSAYVCSDVTSSLFECKSATIINPHQGYLIKPSTAGDVAFTSVGGEMNSNVETSLNSKPFVCNYDLMKFTQYNPSIYMLKGTDATFHHVATGSQLMPFRSYLCLPGGSSVLKLRIKK